jgi:hypothetical protein
MRAEERLRLKLAEIPESPHGELPVVAFNETDEVIHLGFCKTLMGATVIGTKAQVEFTRVIQATTPLHDGAPSREFFILEDVDEDDD